MIKKNIFVILLIICIVYLNCNFYCIFANNEIQNNVAQNTTENNIITEENVIEKENTTNVSNTTNTTIEEDIVQNETEKNVVDVEIEKEELEENVVKPEEETIVEEKDTKEDVLEMLTSEEDTQIVTKQSIEDGVYVIASGVNNSKVLDISGASTANGANVQIWSNDKVDQQKFRVKYLDNGYYSITSFVSNKSLDVAGAGTTNGTNVWQYEANNTYAQQWIIQDAGNGYYYIISRCNNLYLDIANSSTKNGTNVQMYQGNKTNSQKFKFILAEELNGTKTLENGIYTISSALNNNKVLDISGATTISGGNVQLWENTNDEQQKFIITYIENGYYSIENLNSEKVLDVAGGEKANGTNVWQYEKNNSNAQKWVIKDVGDGYYNIISRCGGLFLDVSNGSTKNGTNIQVYEGNNTNAQKFKFKNEDLGGEKTITNGTYVIASKLNTNKVLDIAGASKSSGANVQIWDNVNVAQQEFLITYLGNGFYQIVNTNSAKALDVAGGEKANGTNVWQHDINNSKAQQWTIKDVGDGYYSIISRCNQLYLDISGGYTTNGTNVQVYEENDTNAQKFKLTKIEKDGIDVSVFQGNIDWASVKEEGIDFVIHRIGYRGYGTGKIVEDSMFSKNIKDANKNGIDSGVYFVTQAINYNEGVEEAKWVLDHIKGYNINCPIAIDVEWAGGSKGNNGRADNLSKAERTQAIKGFCDTIKDAGYVPMIYANKDWLTNYIDMNVLYNYNVWLAHYVSGAPLNKSDYKGSYIYWQYTSNGNINGINGYVDLNKGY